MGPCGTQDRRGPHKTQKNPKKTKKTSKKTRAPRGPGGVYSCNRAGPLGPLGPGWNNKPPLYPLEGQGCNNKPPCFGLAGLPVVPSLGLVWPGPVLPALPATTTTAAAKPLPAAEGGRLLLLARQARQVKARPSQGWAQQASQPSQSSFESTK